MKIENTNKYDDEDKLIITNQDQLGSRTEIRLCFYY